MNPDGNNPNKSRFSNLGRESTDYAELSSDYAPPPLSAYGLPEAGDEEDMSGMLDVVGVRARHRQAMILGWVSGVLAVLVLAGGTLFWWMGLQRLNSQTAIAPDLCIDRLATVAQSYNQGFNLAGTATAAEDFLADPKCAKYDTARLFAFAAYAQQGKLYDQRIETELALTNYEAALKYPRVNPLPNTKIAIPTLPADYLSFEEWGKAVAKRRDFIKNYANALKLSQSYPLQQGDDKKKTQTEAVTLWQRLYGEDPLYAKDSLSGVAAKLMEAYRDQASLSCQESKDFTSAKTALDSALQIGNSPALKDNINIRGIMGGVLETRAKVCNLS